MSDTPTNRGARGLAASTWGPGRLDLFWVDDDRALWHQAQIDGAWADSAGGGRMGIENPATGEPIAEVIDASRADVDRAVRAAHAAFYDGRWSKKTPGERSLALWKLADLLEARAEEFARAESENTGKPYKFLSLAAEVRTHDDARAF